jgi:hypothetical protein
MPTPTPLMRLSWIVAPSTVFALAYGLLGATPGPLMMLCFSFVPPFAVAAWLAADARVTQVGAVFDAGWLFAMTWPVAVPWYAVRTRGMRGLGLAARLYLFALAPVPAFVAGYALRLGLTQHGNA